MLLSEGHRDAALYPIAKVYSESRIVREREAARVTRDTMLMQSVIVSALDGAEGVKQLNKVLAKVNDIG